MTIFDIFDFTTAKLMLPIGGFFISIFTGWYLDKKLVRDEITNDGSLKIPVLNAVIFILKYLAPLAILCIFVDGLGLFKYIASH
jgi:NSS family neurotransmitter:Na+ symporter